MPTNGEMAEWFKAHAWKACGVYALAGSNPVLSATNNIMDRSSVQNLLKILSKKLKDPKERIILRNLSDSYIESEILFGKIQAKLERRQWLIDEQIHLQDFRTDLHDEYHVLSDQIQADIRSYFTALKRVLDRVAELFALQVFPKETIDTLWGLLKTVERKGSERHQVLVLSGHEKMMEIVDYRNNFIEHPKGIGDRFFTDTKGARIVYSDGAMLDPSTIDDDDLINPKGSKFIDTMKVDNTNGTYLIYVHINPIKTQVGDRIAKGESIGVWDDGGSGHFKKYGPHMHVYPSPNYYEHYSHDDEGIARSPSLRKSKDKMEKYIKKLLRHLRKH